MNLDLAAHVSILRMVRWRTQHQVHTANSVSAQYRALSTRPVPLIYMWNYCRGAARSHQLRGPLWRSSKSGNSCCRDVIVGMTDASATRSPSIPMTRSSPSTTAPCGRHGYPFSRCRPDGKIVVPIKPAAEASLPRTDTAALGTTSSGRYRACAGAAMIRRRQAQSDGGHVSIVLGRR